MFNFEFLSEPAFALSLNTSIPICTIFFALCVFLGGVRGAGRGLVRQIIHTVLTAVSAFIAYSSTSSLWITTVTKLESMPVEELTAEAVSSGYISLEIAHMIEQFDIKTLEFIIAPAFGVIVIPIAFAVTFIAINAVMQIVYKITTGIFAPKGSREGGRLPALAIGVIEGVLIGLVILVPAVAAVEAADTVSEAIVEENGENETTNNIEVFTNDPLVNTLAPLGIDTVLDSFATLEVDGVTLNVREEFTKMAKLVVHDVKVFEGTKWLELTETDKSSLDDTIDDIESSTYMTELITKILNGTGYILHDMIETDGVADDETATLKIVAPLLSIFENVESDDLHDVLATFVDFYYLLSDESVFPAFSSSDTNALAESFTKTDEEGKTVLTKALDILNSNEYTAPLTTVLVEMTLEVMLGEESAEVGELYDDVKGDFNSIVTSIDTTKPKEEQVADTSAQLITALEENGITVEEEVADGMAEYIVDNYSGTENLSDEEFNDIIFSFYEEYNKYLQSAQ